MRSRVSAYSEVHLQKHRQTKRADSSSRIFFSLSQARGGGRDIKGYQMPTLRNNEPLAINAVDAIRAGDVNALQRLLGENPLLSTARLEDDDEGKAKSQTLLHAATAWPGHFPNGAMVIAVLIAAGVDPNAPAVGRHSETPLHWAASSDDVEVLDALIDAGANIEAPGAVIGGGTPLDDAVAFGQWQAARRLVERGAKTKLWHAAALGLMSHVEKHFDGSTPVPGPGDMTEGFWQACHGGQRQAAEYLLDRGAEMNWIGYNERTPLDISQNSGAEDMVKWLRGRGARLGSELS
jgi:ankyrin repeat protein